MNNTYKQSLLYNLILFDFILLDVSTKKISNFFIQKLKIKNLKSGYTSIVRLSVFDLIKSFKRFIKLFRFIKFFKKKKAYSYFWVATEKIYELVNLLVKQFKLSCIIDLNYFFPFNNYNLFLKTAILIDQPLKLQNYFSFFFKNFYLLQSINSFFDNIHFAIYKIFADLNDFKKIIFFVLLFILIFKD